jgi:hypothetical protein
LDEFVAVTGFHRKHAMRVLRSDQTPSQRARLPKQASRLRHSNSTLKSSSDGDYEGVPPFWRAVALRLVRTISALRSAKA